MTEASVHQSRRFYIETAFGYQYTAGPVANHYAKLLDDRLSRDARVSGYAGLCTEGSDLHMYNGRSSIVTDASTHLLFDNGALKLTTVSKDAASYWD